MFCSFVFLIAKVLAVYQGREQLLSHRQAFDDSFPACLLNSLGSLTGSRHWPAPGFSYADFLLRPVIYHRGNGGSSRWLLADGYLKAISQRLTATNALPAQSEQRSLQKPYCDLLSLASALGHPVRHRDEQGRERSPRSTDYDERWRKVRNTPHRTKWPPCPDFRYNWRLASMRSKDEQGIRLKAKGERVRERGKRRVQGLGLL